MSLTYIDLFSGAGGWGCGLQMAGFQHRGSYEINSSACRTAQFNLGNPVFCTDLTAFNPQVESMKVDLIVGSPPCQGFSNEGYKKEKDPRNSLVWIYFDIIEKLSPSVWIFENVPGFQRLYQGSYYEALKKRLSSMSYYWNAFILDCSHYGVPQKRQRFFVIGAKEFYPEKPQPTHSDFGEVLGTNKVITLGEAISDLPQVGIAERVGIFEYQKPPECSYQSWIREGSKKVYNHTTQNHSKRVLEKIRSVPLGEGMKAFINHYEENKVNYCGGYRRSLKHRPSYTAYWTRGMTSIHPEADRFLSPRECARIQSFPDQFIFKGTTIENYTQVCNAVPPLVARAFGRYLLNILKGQNIPATPWDITRHSENDNGRDNLDTKINQENFPIQLKLPF
ncbi:DNA cytosine methyltransferase [Limnoraphis robusta]|uniref:Cytosine-specific methyltransferase n=1 Tax=Limnoraphis robusta CCNP1315 TaxID=3110306 RepID=A0ABU5U6Z8_9CYAN|nr:DNA cytosine methyltransferase [Limnoraphis robusta]MEA5522934.1 DNA cytosine methyltransferase [Limnoraphis robusta CCNP1315]MEA5548672.1 DNA cytosine methyltransferase [Limnoraphis robusta CCNP1324]